MQPWKETLLPRPPLTNTSDNHIPCYSGKQLGQPKIKVCNASCIINKRKVSDKGQRSKYKESLNQNISSASNANPHQVHL